MPAFQLKAKEVTLPNLKSKYGYDMMDQEKENRELALEGGDSDNSDEEQSGHRRNTNGGGGGLFGGGKQNMRSSQQKNVTSEYFANGNGNWNRGGNENGPTGMGGNN